jgi:uncharacterized LabA/DUF88 family protein
MSEKQKLWLIDGSYFYKAAYNSMRDHQLDYVKLREKLEGKGEIWRAYYLNSATPELEAFFRWLQSAPPIGPKIIVKKYGVRSGDVGTCWCKKCEKSVTASCPTCSGYNLTKEQQKGVDVGLATLALTLMDHYETLLLSSGDSDLLDVAEYLCHRGKRFELVVFRSGVAPELQARADFIYWIDDFAQEVQRERNGRNNK